LTPIQYVVSAVKVGPLLKEKFFRAKSIVKDEPKIVLSAFCMSVPGTPALSA
jgi:hypothetical protein